MIGLAIERPRRAAPSGLVARTGSILAEARRLESTGDPADAARAAELCWQAVTMNDSLCHKWAVRWGNRAVPFDDRLQTARLGMLRAAQKYDPARRVPFPGLARWWVRQALTRDHPQHDVAGHTQERMRLISRLEAEGLDDVAIAEFLGCDLADVRSARAAVLASRPESLETPIEGADATIGGTVAAPAPEYDFDDLPRVLSALDALPPREQQVLTMRFGLGGDAPTTLDRVAESLGLSRERIRQIEKRALNNLKEAVMAGKTTSDRLMSYLELHPGSTAREAAGALGVSNNRVYQLMKELGVVAVPGGRGRTQLLYLPGTAPPPEAPGAAAEQADMPAGPDRSAPSWPELLERARRDGIPGLVDVTWGCGELAELLASAVEALLDAEETVQQLEAELRVVRSQRAAVDDGPRQELAQIRALVGAEHPLPIAVALVVGEARALRGAR